MAAEEASQSSSRESERSEGMTIVMAVGTSSEFSPMMTATSRLLTGCAMVNLYVLHAAVPLLLSAAPTDPL